MRKKKTAPRTQKRPTASSPQQSGLIATGKHAQQSATTRCALDNRSHRTSLRFGCGRPAGWCTAGTNTAHNQHLLNVHNPPPAHNQTTSLTNERARRLQAVARWQSLQELLELLDREARIAHDPTHGEGVNWIRSRDSEDALAIGHHDVLAFSSDPEASLLQSPNSVTVVDARDPGHLHRHVDLADVSVTELLLNDFDIFSDCVSDVSQGVFLTSALRPAPREPGH